MIHTETVSTELHEIAQALCGNQRLTSFRIVGGTAIALHLGHRRSVDIDFFSAEKGNLNATLGALRDLYPSQEFDVSHDSISGVINGVKIELFHDWHMPFRETPVIEGGLRLASLQDLSALKLDAIIGRREKKDYIDLYVIFEKLGALHVLRQFKSYNPNVSDKSVVFALGEVETAGVNKSIMPELLIDLPWATVERAMINAAREFIDSKTNRRTDDKS